MNPYAPPRRSPPLERWWKNPTFHEAVSLTVYVNALLVAVDVGHGLVTKAWESGWLLSVAIVAVRRSVGI